MLTGFLVLTAPKLNNLDKLFCIDFDLIWSELGYSSKQKSLDKLKANFRVEKDFCYQKTLVLGQGGRPPNKYYLTEDCFEKLKLLSHKKISNKGKVITNYVYVIGDKQNDVIKIGVSSEPDKRLSSLQTGYPWELSIWKAVPSIDAYKLESNLHKQFDEYQMKGEWFKGTVFKQIDWNSVKLHYLPANITAKIT